MLNLEHDGWIIECISPFEITHVNGEAKGYGATLIKDYYLKENELNNLKNLILLYLSYNSMDGKQPIRAELRKNLFELCSSENSPKETGMISADKLRSTLQAFLNVYSREELIAFMNKEPRKSLGNQ